MTFKRFPGSLTQRMHPESRNKHRIGYLNSDAINKNTTFSLRKPYGYRGTHIEATIKIGENSYERNLDLNNLDKDFKDLVSTAKTHSNDYSLIEPFIVLDIGEQDKVHPMAYIDSYEVDSGSGQPVVVFGLGINTHVSFNYFPHANTGILSPVNLPLCESDLTEDDGILLVKYNERLFLYDSSDLRGLVTATFIRSLTEERLKEIYYPIKSRGHLENV